GGPVRQARLANQLQVYSRVPLLMAMDAEWGLAMRLDSTVRFPYQMTMGAMPPGNERLIYDMGANLARQCRRLGVHVNFAPSVDVNNNPNNPVINFRSFGEDRDNVATKALAYLQGMESERLLTSIKHFPGHGDTGTDSHFDLPVITKSRAQLDSLELYPFRKLIEAGASGVMVAHLSIPSLDTTQNRPSTLSPAVVTGLLRDELKFQGLIFSDAMNMKGVTRYFPSGIADRKGLEAGMDVLEFTEDVPKAIEEIKKAVAEGTLSQVSLDDRCRKILLAKAWVGLDRYRPIDLTNLVSDLNQPAADLINRQLTERSLTVLKNELVPAIKPAKRRKAANAAPTALLPLRSLETWRVASVSVEASAVTRFQEMLGNYTRVDHFTVSSVSDSAAVAQMLDTLKNYNLVLVGVHLNSIRPGARYGIQPKTAALVRALVQTGKAAVTVFGNPYVLNTMPAIDSARAVLLAYQLTPFTEELSAQAIFGAIGTAGKLPVSVNARYRLGAGLPTPAIGRLKYTIPEEVGLDSRVLAQRVDSVVNVGLTAQAFPGAVVQMAVAGKVIYRKAYGKHTYEGSQPTAPDDLFDLASVTKVSTSTPALMRLVDEGTFDLDKTMGDYLPGFKKSNKAAVGWRDVLTHQARLKAWIPFWREAVNADGSYKPNTFSKTRSKKFPIEVTDSLFLYKKYPQTILAEIRDSPLNAKKEYVYSDLSFYLYPRIVKRLTGQDFEDYLKNTFYGPLGATTLTYSPRRFYPLSRIVPTEYDSLFRHTLIHGRVHDEGAAMLDGLSGHAGLFGSANDLMKLMQLYGQRGSYGGEQLISAKTLTEFTRYQFPELGNRRGLGFEKPSYKFTGNAPRSASAASFGHSGFTGPFVWIDPAYDLTYVFLSNRVYPTRNNNKITQLSIRTNTVEVLYEMLRQRNRPTL
ncbi:MAG: serine hydrolase, partial [Bacteroidetes bacterium]|nr:serine hydrolase [Fibrella sp.]